MSSTKLTLIQRRMNRQFPEKEPAHTDGHGLGVAIESLIADEVERRVGDALERHSPKVDRLFNKPAPVRDFKQLPSVQTTPVPKLPSEILIQRDGAGLARAMVINGQRFLAIRDAAGRIIKVVAEDASDTALPPTRGA